MGQIISLHALIDGPLSPRYAERNRAIMVAEMAAVLVRERTYHDERDAIRSLFGKFSMADIMMCLDDARQVAMQHVVAMEMAAS